MIYFYVKLVFCSLKNSIGRGALAPLQQVQRAFRCSISSLGPCALSLRFSYYISFLAFISPLTRQLFYLSFPL